MTLGRLLALIAIGIGLVVAGFDVHALFEPLVWFVLAIALVVTLDGVGVPGVTRRAPAA